MPQRLLCELLEEDFFRLRLSVRHEHTRLQYRVVVRDLGEFLGRGATIDDLSDDNVTGLLAMLLRRGLSPITVNSRRERINSLWNWAARRGLVRRFPTVGPIQEPAPMPDAWNKDELRKLIAACHSAKGYVSGAPADAYWIAFHRFVWDTGERTGAMLKMTWDMLSADCRIARLPAVIRKGQVKGAIYQLRPATAASLRFLRDAQTHCSRGRVFGFGKCVNGFYSRYSELLKAAGLPSGRRNKPQKLRRSFASWLKKAGGDPTQALNHSDPRTTIVSYLDPTICAEPANKKLFRLG